MQIFKIHKKTYFVCVESVATLFLVHVKVLFENVDNSVVVASEQTDQITKEQDERTVYNAVVQLRAANRELEKRIDLVLKDRNSLKKLVGVHRAQKPVLTATFHLKQ